MFLIGLWQILDELWSGNGRRGWAPLQEYVERDHLVSLLGDLADGVFTSLLQRTGRSRFVDHTPWYACLVPFVDVLYPDSVFVHVVRDGRAVAESLGVAHARGFPWAGSDISERGRLWADLTGAAASGLEALPDDRAITIRYEHLCARPQETLQELLGHLALPWRDEVLEQLAVAHAGPSRPAAVLATRSASGSLALHPRQAPAAWPSSWTRADRSAFRAAAGPRMGDLGYGDN